MRRPKLHLTWVLVAALAACAHAGSSGMGSLTDAASDVAHGSRDPSALALAGWDAYLRNGDGALLATRSDEALHARPDEPWALWGRVEASRRQLRDADEALALLDLLDRAPDHPLGAMAAARLIRLTRRDVSLDDTLYKRGQVALQHVHGETAARLRAALRSIRLSRGDDPAGAAADAGLVTAASVVGPFSPWHELDIHRAFPPESGSIAASYQGPTGVGPLDLRPMRFPTGALSLAPEARKGDVFYLLSVAEVPRDGRYAVRLGATASTAALVRIDGVQLAERRGLGPPDAISKGAVVKLSAGSHLVLVRVDRQAGRGDLLVSIAPEDGSASPVRFRPAQAGDAPGRAPEIVSAEGLSPAPSPSEVAGLLGNGTLGAYVAASDALERDTEQSKRLAIDALASLPGSPPLLVLRAEISVADTTVPDRLGGGRAMTDLETALAKDPRNARALLGIARLLQSAGRNDDALTRLEAAEGAAPGSAAVLVERARVELARSSSAVARELTSEAIHRKPDDCEAGSLLLDLARRDDAIAEADAASTHFARCSDGRLRLLNHLAERGEEDGALALARTLFAESPSDPGAASRLADRLLAGGKPLDAARLIAGQEALWPRTPSLPLRRAELLAKAGDAAGAERARARALSLDGGDVGLRRAMAYKAGTEVLGDQHRDTMKVIHDFEASGRTFDTRAVILLDFAAVEAFADGSVSERTQTIIKVLDKRGIEAYGEFDVPPGAQVLSVRTIKPDGTVLYPEDLGGKDSVSLPGLEVGDYVEREYVLSHASAGPAMPGWTSPPFFFRETDIPLLDSIYVIRAAPGAGLELDAHNGVVVPPAVDKDGTRTVTIEYKDNPAVLAEPLSPSHYETMPWVQAGAGASEMQLGWLFGDGLADDVSGSLEVSTWAHEVAAKSDGTRLSMARALYDDLMVRIPGSEGGYGAPASHILAARQGNRTVLLKAGLDVLGVPAHFAAVRTFDEDPTPFRFPAETRWSYLLMAVEPEPGQLAWLDPRTRWAPFGTIADSAQGVPAILLPGPGEEPRAVQTPLDTKEKGRSDEVTAALSADGILSGKGTERFHAYDAAIARGALEQLDPDRRKQAVEQALARTFRNVEVEDLQIDLGKGVGDDVSILYRFKAPGFAVTDGSGKMTLDLDFFSARLGRRYLGRGARTQFLLLHDPDRSTAHVEIALPKGSTVATSPGPVKHQGPFGAYERTISVKGGKLTLDDRLDLARGRIAPDRYPAFGIFVQAVDQAQSSEVVLKSGG